MMSDDPRAFEQETATFVARVADLLPAHRGEFAVIFRDAVLGTSPTWDEALDLGMTAIGRPDFLIREIQEVRDRRMGPFYVVRDAASGE